MKINKIHIINLNSIKGPLTLDFEKPPLAYSGLFAITGDTGAGKTTILDALTLALFNRTSRGHQDEVMSYGMAEAVAEVEFTNDKGRFLARWEQRKTKKGEPKKEHSIAQWVDEAYVEVGTGLKVTAKKIEELLGMGYEQFKRTVLLAQGEFAAFLNPPGSETEKENARAEVLERLTDTGSYKRLSIAAFERFKQEKFELERLQERLAALRLLDADQLEDLKSQLRQKEQDASSIQRHRTALLENKQWLDQLQRLQNRLVSLEQDVQSHAAQAATLESLRERLARHVALLPFQGQFVRLREQSQEAQKLQTQLEHLAQQWIGAENEKQRLDQALAAAQSQLEAWERQIQDNEALYQQVAILDTQLQGQQEAAQKARADLQEAERILADLSAQHATTQHIATITQTTLADLTEWLRAKNAHDAFGHNVPQAKDLVERLRVLYGNIQRAQTDVNQVQAQQDAAQKSSAQASARAQAAQRDVDQARTTLAAFLRGAQLPTSEAEAEIELDHRVSEGIEQWQYLEAFKNYHTNYRRLAEELAEARESHEMLLAEERGLGLELLNLLEELPGLEYRTSLKQRRYEQQRHLHLTVEMRATLRPGEPCPVCGALEHPLAGQFVAEELEADAKQEWEDAQKIMEATQTQYRSVLERHRALQSQLVQLEEELEGMSTTQLQKIQERLRDHEQRFGVADPVFLENTQAQEAFLTEKAAALNQARQQMEQQRQQFNQMARALREAERRNEQAAQESQHAHNQSQLIGASLVRAEAEQARLNQEMEVEKQKLDALLQPFGFDFAPNNTFKARFEGLLEDNHQYADKKQQREVLRGEMETQRVKIEALAQQEAAQKAVVQQKKAQWDSLSATQNATATQRSALFGDKNPAAERTAAQTTLETLRANLGQDRANDKAHTIRMAQLSEQRSQCQTLLSKTQKEQEALQQDLAKALYAIPILSALIPAQCPVAQIPEILAPHLLAETAAQQAEQTRSDWQKQGEFLAQQQAETLSALQMEQTKDFPFKIPEALATAINDLETSLQDTQQNIGAIRERLAENEQKGQTAGEIRDAVQRQQTELARWEALYKLIGSADGSSFRRFAQGLTLKQLVAQTNRHLDNFQGGRYQLRKKDGRRLELEIIDRFQADNIRSVNTLSGGETFLASLALALGLADMTGQSERVQSLFIDEGFGSLDANALEIALDTLESLQAQGVTIGVISHIREMKERIATQIQVHKRADGFSEVEVVG